MKSNKDWLKQWDSVKYEEFAARSRRVEEFYNFMPLELEVEVGKVQDDVIDSCIAIIEKETDSCYWLILELRKLKKRDITEQLNSAMNQVIDKLNIG